LGRIWNFSAGPSVLPERVLTRVREELLDYRGSGQSVMEMSHRSAVFGEIIAAAKASLRRLLSIPEQYHVLFLQGGAYTQFAMVPLNLLRGSRRADYVDTGAWSTKAIREARKLGGEIRVVAGSGDQGYNHIPDLGSITWDAEADYAHITTNNTIFGTRYAAIPDTGKVPLVADMSSNFLSEPIDVTRFGLIYAGAQKNAGPAGVTIVIVREDLVGHAPTATPSMLDYAVQVKAGSCFNTPPCFAIYVAGLVFDWLLEGGGLAAMARRNREKAALLYDYLDRSDLFRATVTGRDRSWMNVPFLLARDELTTRFLDEAAAAGLVNLKGHRSVGGCRASIYNAMPREGVAALVAFMEAFERTHRGGARC